MCLPTVPLAACRSAPSDNVELGVLVFHRGLDVYMPHRLHHQLQVAQYKYKSETAWTDSGGGASTYFAKPKWQVGPGVPSNTKRDVPDIAFDATENTGQYTYYEGTWYSGYGTSYGPPNMSGYWALVLEALKGKSTGNVASLFYKLGASSSYQTNMHDVATGSNGPGIGPGYDATKDWDYTTGWGSVNGTKALSYFEANP